MKIPLDKIIVDPRVQPRSELIQSAINDYAQAMKDGDQFPPITVFDLADGHYLLAHGFHRFRAACKAEFTEIEAEVKQGDIHDAVLFAVSANNDQSKVGVRFTSADKRHAIDMLLQDEQWATRSDRWIAEKIGVDGKTVATRRAEFPQANSENHIGLDGHKYKAHKPKKSKAGGSGAGGAGDGAENDSDFDSSDSSGSDADECEPEEPRMGREEGESSHAEVFTTPKDAKFDWSQEAARLSISITTLVKRFHDLENDLDSLLAELGDFHAQSQLKKEGTDLKKQTLDIVHMADRVRNKFLGR